MRCLILSSFVLQMAWNFPTTSEAVELPPAITIGESELVLNGSGTREQYFLDMYVAGLYLAEPNQRASAIIEADEPMLIRIEITSKFVSQKKLVASLQEGFEKSTRGKLEPIEAEIQNFRQCFADEIARGDVFDLTYLPGQGVIVFKNGRRAGAVEGLEFKQALFGIWLGADPVNDELRQGLLGATSRTERK